MLLRHVRIQRFRSFSDTCLEFGQRTLLVGPNNAGKSNVLRALDLALNPDFMRRRDPISRQDFFGMDTDRSIEVEVTFADLSTEEQDLFGRENLEFGTDAANIIESSERPDDVDGLPLFLRLTALCSYSEEDDDFTLDLLFTKFRDEEHRVPRRLQRGIGFYLLTTDDYNVRRIFGLTGHTLFRSILRKRGGTLAAERAALQEALESVSALLAENADLACLTKELAEEIASVLPVVPETARFGPGRGGADPLLRSFELVLRVTGSPVDLPLTAHGRGTVTASVLLAAVAFALRYQATFILAIEEPEVALHPHVQRVLLDQLRRTRVQLVMTTHSPVLVSTSRPEELLLTRMEEGETIVRSVSAATIGEQLARSLEKEFLRRLPDVVFSNGVLLVEGETDQAYLEVAGNVWGAEDGASSPASIGLSVVPVDSITNIKAVARRLKALDLRTACIVDNDPACSEDEIKGLCGECDLAIVWPRHEDFYDMEGVIAGGAPVDSLLTGLREIGLLVGADELTQWLVSAAYQVDEALGVRFRDAFAKGGYESWVEWSRLMAGDEEDMKRWRLAIKRFLTARCKHPRYLRILADVPDAASLPTTVVQALRLIQQHALSGADGGHQVLGL